MTPEEFCQSLRDASADNLKAVVLYGSAAAGDFVPNVSGHDILIVATALGPSELKNLAASLRAWEKEGNKPPLLMTQEELSHSADIYPLEYLDIKDAHRLLWGEDFLTPLVIDTQHLRHELEYEFRGKLIHLRERYIAAGGSAKTIRELMIKSVGTFLTLTRGALRLYEATVPISKVSKAEALEKLAARVGFDETIFQTLQRLKAGESASEEVEDLFARYLQALEKIIKAVDAIH